METGVTQYKPKTAVEIRRDMLQIPAVMNALEPVERSVFIASTNKTIAEYDVEELGKDIARALKFISKDVGYRATDESETKYLVVRVCEILKRYYGGMTLPDFRMAFEMCITGQLDDYLPKGRDGQPDRGHYQQFNAEYVCKILNAYRMRRAAILKKANESIPEKEPARDVQREMEMRNNIRTQCLAAFEFFQANGHMPELSAIGEMLVYNELSAVGLAPEIIVTADEQREIFQRTINHYIRTGMDMDVRRLQKAGTDAPELQFGAFKIARRKALKAAFERMVADGIVLTDYIKFE